VLFHAVRLDYHVPIISQQGEIAGRLHVEVYKEVEVEDVFASDDDSDVADDTIRVTVKIHAAANLPAALANFVFCQ